MRLVILFFTHFGGENCSVTIWGRNRTDFLEALALARDARNINETVNMPGTLTALQLAVNTIDETRASNGVRKRQALRAAEDLDQAAFEERRCQKEDVNLFEYLGCEMTFSRPYQ